jgi:hypothetical protein
MRVTLYSDGTYELEATLEHEARWNVWMARPLWDTLRRLEIEDEPPAAAQ